MTCNPEKHLRRSIRLKGYDYSQAGLYFISICLQNRACLFGKIENGKMILNDAGRMVEKWYYELKNKYPDKRCHEMHVMPNHFHCIIGNIASDVTKMDATETGVTETGVTKMGVTKMDATEMDVTKMDVTETGAHVGAPLRGRPDTNERVHSEYGERGRPGTNKRVPPENNYGIDNKKYNMAIDHAIDWFKIMTNRSSSSIIGPRLEKYPIILNGHAGIKPLALSTLIIC